MNHTYFQFCKHRSYKIKSTNLWYFSSKWPIRVCTPHPMLDPVWASLSTVFVSHQHTLHTQKTSVGLWLCRRAVPVLLSGLWDVKGAKLSAHLP